MGEIDDWRGGTQKLLWRDETNQGTDDERVGGKKKKRKEKREKEKSENKKNWRNGSQKKDSRLARHVIS